MPRASRNSSEQADKRLNDRSGIRMRETGTLRTRQANARRSTRDIDSAWTRLLPVRLLLATVETGKAQGHGR